MADWSYEEWGLGSRLSRAYVGRHVPWETRRRHNRVALFALGLVTTLAVFAIAVMVALR